MKVDGGGGGREGKRGGGGRSYMEEGVIASRRDLLNEDDNEYLEQPRQKISVRGMKPFK